MGILPLTFLPGEDAATHEVTGFEKVSIEMNVENLEVNQQVKVKLSTGK